LAANNSDTKKISLDRWLDSRQIALDAMLYLHSSGVWDYEYLLVGVKNFTDHFKEFLQVIDQPGDRIVLELVKYYFQVNPREIETHTESSDAFLDFFIKMREASHLPSDQP